MNHSFTQPVPDSPLFLGTRLPDAEMSLVHSLRQREEKAFAQLYDRYGPALYGIVMKIVREQALAEDVLQEAFVKIWHHFPDYDPSKGRLFTWLLNVTRNLAIDKIRSATFRHRTITDAVEIGREYPVYWCTHQPELMGLDSLFASLKVEEKILIELIYYQGYSRPEVAEQLNIPLGTVKTRLRAAMAKLRQDLIQDGFLERQVNFSTN